MSDLFSEIMNMPCDKAKADRGYVDHRQAYRYGHRDARHAAAELVAAHEADRAQPAEADGVARYDMDTTSCDSFGQDCGAEMEPYALGEWVKYDDHLAALSAVTAERDRLREALEGMLEYFPEGASDGECFAVDAARAAMAAKEG